jgi:CRP/FNR family transcriptional regulator
LQTSGRQTNAGISETELNLPMTRTDIADHLGLTIETVSRAFTRLAKDKIIELDTPSSISLLDRDRLIESAENYQV